MDSAGKTIVITVSSINARHKTIKKIYTNLTKEPSLQFIVAQDRVNRIRVFHTAGPGIRVLIRTYVVLVMPVLIDIKPLHEFYGIVDFHLDDTITQLQAHIVKLEQMRGRQNVKLTNNKNLESVLTDMIG